MFSTITDSSFFSSTTSSFLLLIIEKPTIKTITKENIIYLIILFII
ncbi:MAG: hypothetical protein IKP98_03495 [Bacilli bacterium]|nr:hypothetical protein [Bacilli bacterium]